MPRRSPSPSRLRRISTLLCVAVGAGLFLLGGASLYVELAGVGRIVARAEAPEVKVALIFGAGLGAQDAPSPVLAERLDTGIWLYQHHKVKKLLLTGNSEPHHDEVGVMARYVQDRGVPAGALLLDPKGVSTFESCRRAHALFHLERVVLVTQRFHLPRALFLARAVGLKAQGVAADQMRESAPFVMRELFSRPWALIQAWTQA
jgi:SanA protein